MIVKLYKSILFIVLSLCASAGLAQISSESIPNSISHEDEFKWSPCGDLECMYEYYEVTVFNRWGSKVFHSEDPKEYWMSRKSRLVNIIM